MNLRPAAPVSEEFRMIQDEYLQAENTAKGIVTLDLIPEVHDDLYLWQGDITRLKVGAIVNAANSGMTGLLSTLSRLHRQLHPHLCGH